MCNKGVRTLVRRLEREGTSILADRWERMPRGTAFEKGGVVVLREECKDCGGDIPLVRQFWIQCQLRFLGVAVHHALNEAPCIALGYVDKEGRLGRRTASIARRCSEPLAAQWQGLFWDRFGTAVLGVAADKLTEPFTPSPRWSPQKHLPKSRTDRIKELAAKQLVDARRRGEIPAGSSNDTRDVLYGGELDLGPLGYAPVARECTVDGFHCTARVDIVYRHATTGHTIAVEVKEKEDDKWPPVHQPVAYLFHHDLVLHIRIHPNFKQVHARPDPVRESSRKAMRLLESTGRVHFIKI